MPQDRVQTLHVMLVHGLQTFVRDSCRSDEDLDADFSFRSVCEMPCYESPPKGFEQRLYPRRYHDIKLIAPKSPRLLAGLRPVYRTRVWNPEEGRWQ